MTEINAARTSLEDVEEALKDVIDPELGVNVVDLGLLYGLKYSEEDGALLIDDADDSLALAEAMVRVVQEPGLADRLRARGLAQAERFTWEAAAEQHWDLYRRLVAAPSAARAVPDGAMTTAS